MTRNGKNELVVPRWDDLGPAMRQLNGSQQQFVIAMLETGARNATEAARIAGYGGEHPNSVRTAASNLMRNTRVMAAMREEADKRLNSGAILAASALIEIAGDPLDKNRFKAAVELLNRAGLIVETRHRVVVSDNRTTEEIQQTILQLAKQNGVDPRIYLGTLATSVTVEEAKKADATDAEYTEVSEVRKNGELDAGDEEW